MELGGDLIAVEEGTVGTVVALLGVGVTESTSVSLWAGLLELALTGLRLEDMAAS